LKALPEIIASAAPASRFLNQRVVRLLQCINERAASLTQKCLLVVLVFYLLGVLGVAGGYLASGWDSTWSLGDQLLGAIEMGAIWPLLAIKLFSGA
jgi:hypothetical protein